MNPNAPVTESINQRILELLGLEETFDLDYATYTQALKERLLRVTAFGEKLPTEDFKLLKDELKRVKQKEKTKTFKINPDKLLGKKEIQSKAKITSRKLLLPSSGTLSKVSEVENKSKIIQRLKPSEKEPIDILSRIDEKLSSILETLMSASKLQNKQLELDRKERENKKRQDKESRLEKGGKLVGAVVQKILKPFQSIFDRVWNFIKFTLLGRAFTLLMNWFADPKNKGKVETLGRFLKDWWPALLFAVTAFTNPFGGLVKSVIGTVVRFTFKITKFAIPKLLSLVKANPYATAALAAGIGGYYASQQNEQKREGVKPGEGTPGGSQLQREQVLQRGLGGAFNGGAYVEGAKGVDKIPAWLSDGEFVISRGAVNKFGVPFFETLNAAGGGTNKPKVVNGTTYAAGGGSIGNRREGYRRESTIDPISNIKKFIKYKIGYDVDRPETWGRSFKSTFSNSSKSSSESGNAFDFGEVADVAKQVANKSLNLGSQLYNYGKNKLPTGEEVVQTGANIANRAKKIVDLSSLDKQKNKLIDNVYSSLFGGIRKSEESTYVTPEQFAKLSDEQKLDALIRDPGSASTRTALTLRNQIAQDQQAEFIRGIYDSKRDTGIGGFFKKGYQDVMNRGLIPSMSIPSSLDKTIGNITGGKVKNVSAINAAVQMTVKGLLGPLGKPFRVDASPILEYNKPLMDFAIKNKLVNSKGEYLVGKESWSKSLGDKAYEMVKDPKTGKMVRGEHLYDKMQRESAGSGAAAKIANFGLGQFNFKVGKDGKAIVTDSWDSNQTAGYYFDESKEALKKGDIYNALFKGFSGILRINQNSAFGMGKNSLMNTTPAGIDIKSKSSFSTSFPMQAAEKEQKVMQGQTAVTMYGANDPRRKNTSKIKPQRAWYDPRGWVGKQGGGEIPIGENTGMDIPGATADRQLIAVEPGESKYIVPKGAVQNGAIEKINKIVAMTDPDSNPAKLGYRSKDVPMITPYSQTSSSMTLPPIKSSSGGSGSMPTSPSSLPDFSVVPADGAPMRMANARLLGLVG